MRKAVLAISLLSLFAVPALFAQNQNWKGGQGGRGPNTAAMVQQRVKHLTTLLDLTPAEQEALTTLFTADVTSNRTLSSGMRAAQHALSLAEKNNDSAGVQAASTQIGTLTGQITLARSNLKTAISQILTPDQMTKYNAMGGSRGYGFRGGRPGGPAGPGA